MNETWPHFSSQRKRDKRLTLAGVHHVQLRLPLLGLGLVRVGGVGGIVRGELQLRVQLHSVD